MNINIYFRKKPENDRWLPGDHYLLPTIRRLIRGKKISGIEKVFINLCKGLDELNTPYMVNPAFKSLKPEDAVIVLGIGRYALTGYQQPNRVIAGIGLMTHPADWPGLCLEYPVAKYLQHSLWTKNIYVPYYGSDVCEMWPAGIDSSKWSPGKREDQPIDFLIYNKIMWDRPQTEKNIRSPILQRLTKLGLSFKEIRYGDYKEGEYHNLLGQSKAMLFLCEHESQGFACCEALSMNVPVFAWDQGRWLDPERFKWNDPNVPATSIPFFDQECGMSFADLPEFEGKIDQFLSKLRHHEFNPRNFILENLTLKKSAQKMLAIIDEVYA